MDYEALRTEGIQLLERIAGHAWTDFNAHDPGITILEQLCYAITELGYRIDHDLPDLLAGDADPYQSLYSPRTILTTEPVTLLDLRKLLLDVTGVRNAWIEPIASPNPALVHHEGDDALRLADSSSAATDRYCTKVALAGLYRVLIAVSDVAAVDGAAVVRNVIRTIHAHRPLSTDFPEIRALDPEDVAVNARVEIAPELLPGTALLSIYETIAEHIAPSVPFFSLSERMAAGEPLDEIFAGPPLERGFIDSKALARLTRKTAIHTSDLLHAMMDIPGVRAVQDISLWSDRTGAGNPEPWTLALQHDRVPRFDFRRSAITLLQGGIELGVDRESVAHAYLARRASTLTSRARAQDDKDRAPPRGRDHHVGRYTSIQLQLPACYGIGETGLPKSAPADRRARTRQLKAYLLFFDQLLANAFAQLDHVKTLFAFHSDDGRTYAAQPVDRRRIDIDAVLKTQDQAEHARWLQEVTGNPARSRSSVERTRRFLDHLLARFAEQLVGSTQTDGADKPARDRRLFLRSYPRISAARGTGFDYTRPRGPDNRSGLEERIHRALGLEPEAEETFLLIEHILLRPISEDRHQLGENEARPIPLLAASPYRDPYSLKLSFAFPSWPPRFMNPAFRQLIEQTVRAETPAHLTPFIHWLARDAWESFVCVYDEWLDKHRAYWVENLGV